MTQTVKVGASGFVIESVSQSIRPDGGRTTSPPGVEGGNSRYGFTLTRGRNDPGYVLAGVQPSAGRTRPEVCHLSYPFANQQPAGRTYLDLVKNPNTTVIGYEDTDWLGRPAKRLTVEFGIIGPQTGKPMTVRTAILFRPDQGWVCCGTQHLSALEPTKPPDMEDRYTYTPVPGELPVPKLAETWLDPAGPKQQLNWRTEFLEFKRHATPLPDSDFTLAAYKLPEPEGMTELDPRLAEGGGAVPELFPADPSRGGGVPGWVWLVAGGLAVVVLLVRVRRSPHSPGG